MIVFGSQRGSGRDLATHLLNTHDNEHLELADLRGSIAEDLHGAFAEWEAQAHAMTKAKKYLYSLSINPDPTQGRLTRAQYEDYIARAEQSLGLMHQPRAMVFHIKEGVDGALREHCHVVWSRTDVQDCKAVHIPFDRQKLMMVTRAFAHDHGLKLPEGYETGRAQKEQLSLYEKAQQDQTGLTKEDRQELITELWHSSDSAKAFVNALEDNGYTLATGRRPYVLVDIYGHTNALPKMIDDKTVKTKVVRAFLEGDFPLELLPSVEEAQDLAKAHLGERKHMKRSEEYAEQHAVLEAAQQKRRHTLEQEISAKAARHAERSRSLLRHQREELAQLKGEQARQDFEIAFARSKTAPTGLKAVLAKVSGVALIRRKLQAREDRLRAETQAQARVQLEAQQRKVIALQSQEQVLEMQDLKRQERALRSVFDREKRSLEMAQRREYELLYRRRYRHEPSLQLTLTPGGRSAVLHKAKNRYYMQTANEVNVKAASPLGKKHAHSKAAKSLATSTQSKASRKEVQDLGSDFEKTASNVRQTQTKKDSDDVPVHDKDRDDGLHR